MKMVTIAEHEKQRSYMQRLIAGNEDEIDDDEEACVLGPRTLDKGGSRNHECASAFNSFVRVYDQWC